MDNFQRINTNRILSQSFELIDSLFQFEMHKNCVQTFKLT